MVAGAHGDSFSVQYGSQIMGMDALHYKGDHCCFVFGGPDQYTEDLGGYERTLAKHLDLGITEDRDFASPP